MTPLSSIYRHVMQQKLTNKPHTAKVLADHEGDGFHGMVCHGTASRTTLVKKWQMEEDAIAHAQHFCDALNETPHTDNDPSHRMVAMAHEVQACIDHHLTAIKIKEGSENE